MQPQQGFYYPQTFGANMAPNANAPAFVPAAQQQQPQPVQYTQQGQNEVQAAGQVPSQQPQQQQQQQPQNLVDARESQGTVYYDYYSPQVQVPAMPPGYPPAYPGAATAAGQPPYAAMGMVAGIGGMMAPSPDPAAAAAAAFYYQQAPMPYYPQ
jgi:hypothetical protein